MPFPRAKLAGRRRAADLATATGGHFRHGIRRAVGNCRGLTRWPIIAGSAVSPSRGSKLCPPGVDAFDCTRNPQGRQCCSVGAYRSFYSIVSKTEAVPFWCWSGPATLKRLRCPFFVRPARPGNACPSRFRAELHQALTTLVHNSLCGLLCARPAEARVTIVGRPSGLQPDAFSRPRPMFWAAQITAPACVFLDRVLAEGGFGVITS